MTATRATASIGVLREGGVAISRRVVKYSELLVVGAMNTVRIRIEASENLGDGFGIVERWDGQQWREVWTIPAASLQVWHAAGVTPGHVGRLKLADFATDRDELIDIAQDVLS